MITKFLVKRGQYQDSVFLMSIGERARALPGIQELALMMGTSNNKDLLAQAGFMGPELTAATANDLIVAVQAETEEQLDRAIKQVDESMASRPTLEKIDDVYPTLDAALAARPETNLAIISVPGEFAARECRMALERGLNVLLFSDNVPIEQEIELKELASLRRRIVMGPDCGTAIINHVPLGFANAVRAGRIGIVAAAGTGIQEVACLLDLAGLGISQAIGTGGRDVTDRVGGISMLEGLHLLDQDDNTDVVVLISKPPGRATRDRVMEFLSTLSKPAVVAFLGAEIPMPPGSQVKIVHTLEEAARAAAELAALKFPAPSRTTPRSSRGVETSDGSIGSSTSARDDAQLKQLASDEAKKMSRDQKYVRGLYSGGTLCYEAMLVLERSLGDIYSNIPLRPELQLENLARGCRHTCIDLGDDWFTRGKPHPMISPDTRNRYIETEGGEPEVAVLLLDLILGYGSHPDMAGALAPYIKQVKNSSERAGRHLAIIASICGTERDPQGLTEQAAKLREAGVIVMESNAQAAHLAALIGGHLQERR